MKKRLAGFLAVAMLLAGFGVLSSASPATATGECTGQGNAHLNDAQLGVWLVHPNTTTSFDITATTTVGCVSLKASGTLTGACGRSIGTGTVTMDGTARLFDLQTAGSIIVLTNSSNTVAGVGNAVANATTQDSCASKTADDFLVTAAVVIR